MFEYNPKKKSRWSETQVEPKHSLYRKVYLIQDVQLG